MAADLRLAYLGMHRAREESFPPECLDYLYHLIYRCALQPRGFRPLSPTELGQAFQRQVLIDFGGTASVVLEKWGFATFGDLGRAVFLLSKYGCLSIGESERIEDYEAMGAIRLE